MEDYKFKELICLAKAGNINATKNIISMFEPLIKNNSFIDDKFNEDTFQELNIELIRCINKFDYSKFYDIFSMEGES